MLYTGTWTRVTACLDSNVTGSTIRTSVCELLVSIGVRCTKCVAFRRILNAKHHRMEKSKNDINEDRYNFYPCVCRCLPSSKTNYRFLSTPEKVMRMKKLHSDVKVAQQSVRCLTDKLAIVKRKNSITVDPELHSDLSAICKDASCTSIIAEKHPPGSFGQIFWEQQVKANSLSNSHSMRWHPLMIWWCIYLRHLSSSAYETLRSSGVIKLPSQ